jgi:hypothetical protein
MKDLLTLSGSEDLLNAINWIAQFITIDKWVEVFPVKDSLELRRLGVVHDPEGKTRTIAILDYWSQSSLKPLHDFVMKKLKSLSDDRTYSQNRGFQKDPQSSYWSLDLSNATDRFPIEFQSEVIKQIFGDQYSKAWVNVMISLPFKTPKGDMVFYKAGQPMGAYSSWAVFALSHHVLVHIAAMRCGKDPKSLYMILGDDIVIGEDNIAKSYIKLCQELDIQISSYKTHISNTMYEFAKRWYW